MYDITLKYTVEYLRGMSPDDLDDLLNEARRLQYGLRCQSQLAQPEHPDLFKKARKDIARIMTVKND